MKILITSLCLTLALLPLGAWAAENRNTSQGQQESIEVRAQRATLQENSVNNLTPQPRITRRQATSIANDRYEGRVVGVSLENNNWRVRMDRDGTVFNVFINASSGDVSGSSD